MGAGGLWTPDMAELAGGAHHWLMPGDASCSATWDQVRVWRACGGRASPGGHRSSFWPIGGALIFATAQLGVAVQVTEYAPEVIIIAPIMADVHEARDEACQLAGLPGWWSLPAVRTGAIFVCHHSFFSQPGPRWAAFPEIGECV